MSVFDLDLGFNREGFELEWKLKTDASWVGLFGESGRGKTTALEVLLGWHQPIRGAVRFPKIESGVGYAPQDLLLFPHWSVADNLLACRRGPLPAKLRDDELYEALGLEPLLKRQADCLSGGEGRRVALARAIFAAPDEELLVLDEPLASLDRGRRALVLGFLLALKSVRRGPTMIVSHSAVELGVLADVVQCIATQERGGRSISRFTEPVEPDRAFGGERAFENLLFADVLSIQGDAARCALWSGGIEVIAPSHDLTQGDRVLLGLHGDDVLLGVSDPGRISARNRFQGKVYALQDAGAFVKLSVNLGPHDANVSTHLTHAAIGDLGLKVGVSVFLFFKTRSVRTLAVMPGSSRNRTAP